MFGSFVGYHNKNSTILRNFCCFIYFGLWNENTSFFALFFFFAGLSKLIRISFEMSCYLSILECHTICILFWVKTCDCRTNADYRTKWSVYCTEIQTKGAYKGFHDFYFSITGYRTCLLLVLPRIMVQIRRNVVVCRLKSSQINNSPRQLCI